jgi:hypothetical protein
MFAFVCRGTVELTVWRSREASTWRIVGAWGRRESKQTHAGGVFMGKKLFIFIWSIQQKYIVGAEVYLSQKI